MGRPVGILYEHPRWFLPLFAELDRRGIAYEPTHAGSLLFDPADDRRRYDVNALSNFVANAPEVVGFDPFGQLVDLIVDQADATSERRPDPVGAPAGLA